MTIRIVPEATIDGEILDYLLEAADGDYLDAGELRKLDCLAVYDEGALIFVMAFQTIKRPHGDELEITLANGSRCKEFSWVKHMAPLVDDLCEARGCNRVLVPVTRKALGKALTAIGYIPFTTFFMKRFG